MLGIIRKKSERRCSSKIFSLAKNSRMSSIYKYDEIKTWTFDEIFEFESIIIKNKMGIGGAKSIIPNS